MSTPQVTTSRDLEGRGLTCHYGLLGVEGRGLVWEGADCSLHGLASSEGKQ